MPEALRVEGTVRLDGPAGRVSVTGRGRTLEVRVRELRRVPSLARRLLRLREPLSGWLSATELEVAVGKGPWLPLVLRPDRDRSRTAVSFQPWRFSTPPHPPAARSTASLPSIRSPSTSSSESSP